MLTTMLGGDKNKGNRLEEGEAIWKGGKKKGKLSHNLVIELLKIGEQWPSLCLHGGDGCESRELRTDRALGTRIGLGTAASCPAGIMERLCVPLVSFGMPQRSPTQRARHTSLFRERKPCPQNEL